MRRLAVLLLLLAACGTPEERFERETLRRQRDLLDRCHVDPEWRSNAATYAACGELISAGHEGCGEPCRPVVADIAAKADDLEAVASEQGLDDPWEDGDP